MSKRSWQGRVAVWAGWLLAGSLILVLAVGAMVLSPDGARLRRLAGARAVPEGGDAVLSADYDRPPTAVLAAAGAPGTVPTQARGLPSDDRSESTGFIVAETIGSAGEIAVYLDGELRGVAPIMLGGVVGGIHTLSFGAGEGAWEEEVRVSAGDTTIIACAVPGGSTMGQMVINSTRNGAGALSRGDSVLVNGRFVGAGELSLEVSSGYHCVSFLSPGAVRSNTVLHVPPGSVQYISVSEIDPPFSITGVSPRCENDIIHFEARLSMQVEAPSELSLLIVPREGSSLKAASLPRRPSDGVYAGGLPLGQLPSTEELRYFYRAMLSSGREIDSPILSVSIDRLSPSKSPPGTASITTRSE